MRLSDFKSAPPVSSPGVPPSSPEPAEAEPQAPQEEQFTTSLTPSGMGVYYSWAPRRYYKLGMYHEKKGIDWDACREVPSVTNVLGVLDKSGALTWWGQGVGVDGVLELLKKRVLREDHYALYFGGECGSDGWLGSTRADKDSITQLLTEHKLTVNHQKDKAADRGVNVHGALEAWVENGRLPIWEQWPEAERGYVQGLAEFMAALSGVVGGKEAELMVGSLEHSYAGRFDLVLTLNKPVEVVTKTYPKRKPRVEEIPAGRYLLDLKTSKGIYSTHYLQLEAYEAAAVECGYEPTDHRGVIHVTADGRYELALNRDWTFEDFLAVRKCYQHMNERSVVQALRDELDAKEVA